MTKDCTIVMLHKLKSFKNAIRSNSFFKINGTIIAPPTMTRPFGVHKSSKCPDNANDGAVGA